MNYHRGQRDGTLPAVAAQPAGQKEQGGPYALAAALADVAADLPHQADVGAELLLEDLLDAGEVLLDQGHDVPEVRDPPTAQRIHRCHSRAPLPAVGELHVDP